MVQETIEESHLYSSEDEGENWELFLLTIRSKSISYSQKRAWSKKKLKREIIQQIKEMEKNSSELEKHVLAQYNYLTRKLKEIEQLEIEGYKTRVKYLPTHEKNETDIDFYSKIEKKKIAEDRIG